jgi:hypothetical protein
MIKRITLQTIAQLPREARRVIAILLLTIFVSLLPTISFAGLDTLVKNVFPSGTMSNVTKGAITREQEGGHLTGGSVVIKTPPTLDFSYYMYKHLLVRWEVYRAGRSLRCLVAVLA